MQVVARAMPVLNALDDALGLADCGAPPGPAACACYLCGETAEPAELLGGACPPCAEARSRGEGDLVPPWLPHSTLPDRSEMYELRRRVFLAGFDTNF